MSKETKHTPGPWVFGKTTRQDQRLILGGPGRKYVASVTVQQIPRPMGIADESEREANARLITAAPEMLEALEELLSLPNKQRPQQVWEEARVAVAKARGEKLR